MRRLRRSLTAILCVILFLSMSGAVYAEEAEELPDAETYVEEVVDALPPEVEELLPEADSYGELPEKTDTAYLLSVSLFFLKKALSSFTRSFALLLAFVLFAALSERIENSLGDEKNGLASFVVILVVGFHVFSEIHALYLQTAEYCEKLSAYMMTLNGLMASVSLLGGGAVEASVRGSSLGLVVSLLGSTVTLLLLPIVRISFASALTSSLSPRMKLDSIGAFFRNAFTFLLGFLATVSVVALTFQTTLAQAEDTLTARSLRFAAGSSIPYVGGAVSDSMRTLFASVSVIRKSVGTLGAVGLLLMLLYPLSTLVSYKLALSFAKAAAGVMGADTVGHFFEEAVHLVNMMIGCLVILSLLYIFIVALFALSTQPLG